MSDYLIDTFENSPKKIFLLDACGAALTAFMLGVVLPYFQKWIRIPVETLKWLALIALLFALYSFSCYFKTPQKWRTFLKIIALLNMTYCVVTSSILFLHFQQITALGCLYFIVEIFIILFIVRLEWKVASI